ncbi:hypothetical protein B1L02_10345 [Pseudoalteromonas piscicida]|uniref:Uncharacterized protein n=2 Tax=Pseudoalteromonas piscicida TaxID=43662 RepID=A0AAD0W3B8_PSEO7|nr:hypothetical protein B1L02_10345 [Pseudoalteromonas piscicida]AXR01924.1 hypothetical protein D0511_07420 [Pseudoalteromonas piscicida]
MTFINPEKYARSYCYVVIFNAANSFEHNFAKLLSLTSPELLQIINECKSFRALKRQPIIFLGFIGFTLQSFRETLGFRARWRQIHN